jgi:hypothetical protein
MTPNKKIYNHSFLGGLGKLKFFDEDGNPLCYKTQNFLEPGYIFAPYIPRIEDSSEFKPKRSLKSRYAQRVVNNSFYGTMEQDGTE